MLLRAPNLMVLGVPTVALLVAIIVDEQSNPLHTYPTSPVGEVFVANKRLAQKRRRIVALGRYWPLSSRSR